MLCKENESLESRNFKDHVNFTRNDPCIFITFPPGAAGDLLISIIDKHYLKTGCEYYGISDNGKVRIYTTDYNMIDRDKMHVFNEAWFTALINQLSIRNLNYSLLDQVIFGCHMWDNYQLHNILDTFPNAKIINIRPRDYYGGQLISFLKQAKLFKTVITDVKSIKHNIRSDVFVNDRVLTLPFGALFSEQSYYYYYSQIIEFLGLEGRLICFDYIKYYLSKQHPIVNSALVEYSETLCLK